MLPVAFLLWGFSFSPTAHYLIGLFVFWMFNFLSSFYTLVTKPLLYERLAEIFSHSEGRFFVQLIISFAIQKCFDFMRSRFLIINLILSYWSPIQKKKKGKEREEKRKEKKRDVGFAQNSFPYLLR